VHSTLVDSSLLYPSRFAHCSTRASWFPPRTDIAVVRTAVLLPLHHHYDDPVTTGPVTVPLRQYYHHWMVTSQAAKLCGFWEDTSVVIFSEFGRRFEENSRRGTDHGWGQYFMLFASGLRRQVCRAPRLSREFGSVLCAYCSEHA